jgi:Tfp pilus assembly protein PilX
MITSSNLNNRNGFIIVISLTLMLVMTSMGIGLYYSSKKTAELVGENVIKSDSFYAAETCIAEARLWLQAEATRLGSAPCGNTVAGTICQNATNNANFSSNMTTWNLPTDPQRLRNRAQNQNYICSISLLGSVAFEGGDGTGFDIGKGTQYGNAAIQTKFMYRIRASGSLSTNTGFNNFSSEVEVIDSMIF